MNRIKKSICLFPFISIYLFGQSTISINHDQLNFGAVENGPQTPIQTIFIDNSGTGVLNWMVTPNENWIEVNPQNGTGPGLIEVFINATELPIGEHFGSILIIENSATNSPQIVPVNLDIYSEGNSSNPFGSFDTPLEGSTVNGMISITGWALDDLSITDLTIYKDIGNGQEYSGMASFIEGARPDVETAYPDYPNHYQAGWGFMFLTNFLPNGSVTLSAEATDIEGNNVTLGTKTVIIDNFNAVKPFGDIDTPVQGGIASGTNYPVEGWALTPQPNTIPTDGSTITIYVDGVNVGNAAYNLPREDIATLLPGYNNSNGAGFSYDLNTTNYSNGVHSIQAIAIDNVVNSDGIGARYFTIFNQSTLDIDNTNFSVLPEELTVLKPYPNPFNPNTTITYGIQKDSRVTISIYDIIGKFITTIFNTKQTQGWHSIVWDGTNANGTQVPAGIYISKIISNNNIKTIKLMLLK